MASKLKNDFLNHPIKAINTNQMFNRLTENDPKKCEDLAGQEKCKEWKKKGDCTRLPDYMLQNCMKSCELCGQGK